MTETPIERMTRQIKQIVDRNPDEQFLQRMLLKATSWEQVFHEKYGKEVEDEQHNRF